MVVVHYQNYFAGPVFAFQMKKMCVQNLDLTIKAICMKHEKDIRFPKVTEQAEEQIKNFGKTGIEFSLNEQFRLSIEASNEIVQKNRRILKHY